MLDLADASEADLLHHALRCQVVGPGEGDDVGEPQLTRQLQRGACRLRRQALAPAIRNDGPRQLDGAAAVDRRPREAATACEGTRRAVDERPGPEAVLVP